MRRIIIDGFWLVLNLLAGFMCIIEGYSDNTLISLIMGSINFFFAGVFALVLIVEIIWFRLEKEVKNESL